MRAALLSAVYANYDSLKPVLPQLGADVDWVVVTDDPALAAAGWRVVYEPRPGTHPNRAAKTPKMLPWRYTDAPASVWVDASYQVVSATFVRDVVIRAHPVAQWGHPWRGCIYDEAEASAGIPKYAGEPIAEQVAAYRERGHPTGWGLWATGVIARRHDDPRVRELGERWLEHCYRWSFQDQLSEPVLLRELGLRPSALPGTHLANPWLAYQGSERH